MSGIAGFFSKNRRVDTVDVLRRMLTRIKHRGLFYNAIYVSNYVGLGNAKSFSNKSQNQKLLLTNKEETLWIVWNGRVFNHSELSSKLLKLVYLLNTSSDSELVLQLYEAYGVNCLNVINGQFAFCIWDSIKKEMFLARDRVGVCPLYYSSTANDFVFGSEMKAIFEYPDLTPKISAKSLSQVVTFWSTISPNTIFEGVYELSPGHYLTLNSSGIQSKAYWTYPTFHPHDYSSCNLADSIEELDALLSDAVTIRTPENESYGAYLSGGIDSSVTTSFIKKNHPNLNLNTFSISFTDNNLDESLYQNLAVDYYNTIHSRVICSSEDITANFQNAVWHAETTLLRTAPIPMFLLSKLAHRNNIKTVISGEGADEILGGYNIFKEAIIREFWAKFPSSKFRPLLLNKLYPYLPQMQNSNNNLLKMFFGYKLTETSSPVYSHLLRWHNTSRIKNYFSSELKYEINDYDPVEEVTDNLKSKLKGVDLLSRAQWIESTIFMQGYLLSSQGERMTGANSVEGRYPFLDHRVIEFCMKLKPEYKLKGLNEKYILKKMMENRIPQEIINRQKQPFRAPKASILTSEHNPPFFNEMLSKEKINSAGFFDFNKVNHLIEKMKLGGNITEVDNMAFNAILSTQVLASLFNNNNFTSLPESDLITLDYIIYDRSIKPVQIH
ncbi:MAG: asparagine synthase (glutamine-hydrolyzing) [Dysgonamonadaceae bacterium]|nr:asparagine synthase (glutamine-hydrolyzing) [Dysgonamonadaceae bacterium]